MTPSKRRTTSCCLCILSTCPAWYLTHGRPSVNAGVFNKLFSYVQYTLLGTTGKWIDVFFKANQQKDWKEQGFSQFSKQFNSPGHHVPPAFQLIRAWQFCDMYSWQVQSLYLLTYLKATVASVCSRHALYQSSMPPLSQESMISAESFTTHQFCLDPLQGFSPSSLHTASPEVSEYFHCCYFSFSFCQCFKGLVWDM